MGMFSSELTFSYEIRVSFALCISVSNFICHFTVQYVILMKSFHSSSHSFYLNPPVSLADFFIIYEHLELHSVSQTYCSRQLADLSHCKQKDHLFLPSVFYHYLSIQRLIFFSETLDHESP